VPNSVFCADLDGDGDMDVVTANQQSYDVSVLENRTIGYQHGDANGDWIIDVGDVIYLINYLYRNGSAPDPVSAGDANCDSTVDSGDVVFLINYLFREGPPSSC
jgi:hypothetical protein